MGIDFNFEEYYDQVAGWTCRICGSLLPPDPEKLEDHYESCKYQYIQDRKAEIQDEIIKDHWEREFNNLYNDDWIKCIDDFRGSEIAEEYKILTLQNRIPEKDLKKRMSI